MIPIAIPAPRSYRAWAAEVRFEEEGKHAFHGKRLSNYAAGGLRKCRPVRSELKFHGNAGDDADSEVDAENPGPETRGAVVMLVAGA